MTSFTVKALRFTFVLSNNATFEGTGNNTLVISGLRAAVEMKGSGLPAFPQASMRIFGMRQDDMNALTALAFRTFGLQKNSVVVEANGGDGWSTIFAGQIMNALPDYSQLPDVAMVVQAQTGGFELVNPATPAAYTGATDVAVIVANIAAKMGVAFENNGVTTQLDSPYFAGTLGDQLRAVQQASGVAVYQEAALIAITPPGVPRSTPVWVLSPATGLVGYPTFDSYSFVRIKALYNPAFRFGGRLRIEGSDIPRTNGDWIIGALTNNLESVKPGGNWFSEMTVYPPGELPPL